MTIRCPVDRVLAGERTFTVMPFFTEINEERCWIGADEGFLITVDSFVLRFGASPISRSAIFLAAPDAVATGMSTRGCGSRAGDFLRVAASAPDTEGIGGGGAEEDFFATPPLATVVIFLRRASSRRILLSAEDDRWAMRAGMVMVCGREKRVQREKASFTPGGARLISSGRELTEVESDSQRSVDAKHG